MKKQAKGGDTDIDLLQLHHINGYNGKYRSTIHHLPTQENKFTYSIGGLVIVEDITDRNIQNFMRGHDMTITAMAVSHNGKH